MIRELRATMAAMPRGLRLRIYLTAATMALGLLLIAAGTILAMQQARGTGVDADLAASLTPEVVDPEPVEPPREPIAEPEEDPEECWPIYGRTPARTSDGADLNLPPPGEVRWRRRMGSLIEFPASLCDSVLYLNTADGITAAIDADTGEAVWERQTADPADSDTPGVYDTTPAIAGDRIIVTGKDGYARALDRDTGRELWRLDTGSAIESSPAIIGDHAFFGNQAGQVLKVRTRDGTVVAAYRTGGKINASPAIAAGRLYITNYGGEITALRVRDLSEVWTERRLLQGVRPDPMYASPSVAGGTVFAASIGGNLYALDAETGAERWRGRATNFIYTKPVVSGGRVFIGSHDNTVRAFDVETGRLAWSQQVDDSISGSGVVIGDLVFFSTLPSGTTYGFDVRSGEERWRWENGRYVPGIASDRRYYFSFHGMLLAIDPADPGAGPQAR